LIRGELSEWGDYGIAALSGAAGGEAFLYGGPVAAGAAGAAVDSGLTRLRHWGQGKRDDFGLVGFAGDTALGGALGYVIPGGKIKGITVGRNSYIAIQKQIHTKLSKGLITDVSLETMGKMAVGQSVSQLPSALVGSLIESHWPDTEIVK